MQSKHVKCDSCDRDAPVVGQEGQILNISNEEKAQVFDVIECPECGRQSQLCKTAKSVVQG